MFNPHMMTKTKILEKVNGRLKEWVQNHLLNVLTNQFEEIFFTFCLLKLVRVIKNMIYQEQE